MKEKRKKYATIFFTCLYLSSFTFGGGLVIVPMMRKKFVDDLKWLEEKEMMDLTAIAQSSPGAIVVNAAILLGYKIGGVFGSLLAILGTIIPPMTIIAVVSVFYCSARTQWGTRCCRACRRALRRSSATWSSVCFSERRRGKRYCPS